MAWFAELAGKAENLLNNIDEQTGAALRNHSTIKSKKRDITVNSDKIWSPNKRSAARSPIRAPYELRSRSSPNKKNSLTYQAHSHPQESENNDPKFFKKKTPVARNYRQNTSNISPILPEIKNEERCGLRRRRYSVSGDIDTLNRDNVYKLQNLEVENAMIKNEMNVMNREISDLLDRLRKTEEDYTQYKIDHNDIDLQYHKLKLDNEVLQSQLDSLRRKLQDFNSMDAKNREQSQELETETSILKNNVKHLEERIKELIEDLKNKDASISKLEKELRHTQAIMSEQQGSLEKSTSECLRLEKDWESYKLRVKGMLYAKDDELRKLREGTNLSEDTTLLMKEIESLKKERADLLEELSRANEEGDNLKDSLKEIKSRLSAVEKIVLALRDALKDERSARNKAEMQCSSIGKELKACQLESGQTIAKLRAALQLREDELNNLRESSQVTTDTSALNVADYDVAQAAMETERVEYLTQMLVKKQGRIEALLADNNTLRIQLDKLQTKYKTEVAVRSNAHSIVQLQDGDNRPRARTNNYSPVSTLSKISLRVGVLSKRYPVFRVFIIFYMIVLHLWVFTVLLSRTPEDYIRPTKT